MKLSNAIAAVLSVESLRALPVSEVCGLAAAGGTVSDACRELVRRGEKAVEAYAAHLTAMLAESESRALSAFALFTRIAKHEKSAFTLRRRGGKAEPRFECAANDATTAKGSGKHATKPEKAAAKASRFDLFLANIRAALNLDQTADADACLAAIRALAAPAQPVAAVRRAAKPAKRAA